MRKFVFLISILITLITPVLCFSQAGWYVQNSGTTRNLNDIFFIDQKTGWAVGDSGAVLRTKNGGYTWFPQNSGTIIHLNKVQFINPLTGWIVGGMQNSNMPCSYYLRILKTTNGGESWSIQNQSDFGSLQLYDLSIPAENSIFTIGEGKDVSCSETRGGILYSANSGVNWSGYPINGSGLPEYKSISFINSLTGYATYVLHSDFQFATLKKLLKTTNGGVNWSEKTTDSTLLFLNDNNFIRFFNENTGYYINGNFLKTTNGGNNWSKFDSLSVYGMSKFSFLNLNTGYLVGANKLVKTFNGGVNWITNSGTTFTALNSICAVDTNHVWACGNGGKIIYGGNAIVADTASIKYYPLKIGNSWTYKYETNLGESSYSKVTIVSDTIINGITFFKMDNELPFRFGTFITADSLTGNFYLYWDNTECTSYPYGRLLDSLNSKLEDTSHTCPSSNILGICTDTNYVTMFGSTQKSKYFITPPPQSGGYSRGYLKNFGLVYSFFSENTHLTTVHLTGCAINGVVYGDTAVFSPFRTYLPLKVGNSWTYRIYNVWPPLDDTVTTTIVSESTIGGIKYFTFSGSLPTIGENTLTLDTITGNILSYHPGASCSGYTNQVLIDSLGARNGNTVRSCASFSLNGMCSDTVISPVFGETVHIKRFGYQGGSYPGRTYSEKFGLIYAYTAEVDYISYTLLNCRINGVNYGSSAQTVSGSIKFSDNNQAASNGYVKAIKLNTSNGNIITFDSVQIGSNGDYILHNLPIDTCYIVAYPNSEKQADFIPTYFPSTIHWQSATKVFTGSNPSNINVAVYRKSSIHGNYTVNGWVMPQTNSPYTGINGAVVYVKEGNIFRDYYVTNAPGQYNVNELAPGGYLIVADRLGYIDGQQSVTVTNSNLDNVNFTLIPTFTGIHTISNILPGKYYLYQNYPNPFNPVTNIKFDIPKSSFVTLKVYNVLGKEVSILLNEVKDAGSYRVDFDASALPSGVYFYRLETETFTETRRMMLLK